MNIYFTKILSLNREASHYIHGWTGLICAKNLLRLLDPRIGRVGLLWQMSPGRTKRAGKADIGTHTNFIDTSLTLSGYYVVVLATTL